MITTIEQPDLSQYSTMRIGGFGKVLYVCSDPERDLIELSEKGVFTDGLWHVIGEGSDSVFGDDLEEVSFIIFQHDGQVSRRVQAAAVHLTASAAMPWNDLVMYCVDHDLQGIESMIAIPGTVGAAPVHNIGAYGTEFSDVCVSVSAFDTQTGEVRQLSHDDLDFSYRKSIFKKPEGKHLIVTGVTIELFENGPVNIPDYPGVAEYFIKNNIDTPTLRDIAEGITEIRWSKLPRPSELPNCGSFFANPYLEQTHINELLKRYPDMPHFPHAESGKVKVPAGWMIDQLGLKGYMHPAGHVGVYQNHALVLVHHDGKGSYAEFVELIDHINERIIEAFGIQLRPEVCMIDRAFIQK